MNIPQAPRIGTKAEFDASTKNYIQGQMAYLKDRGVVKIAREAGSRPDIRFDELAGGRRHLVGAAMYPSNGLPSIRFFTTTQTQKFYLQKNHAQSQIAWNLTGGGKSAIHTYGPAANDVDFVVDLQNAFYMGHEYKFMGWAASSFVSTLPNPLTSIRTEATNAIILTGIGFPGPEIHTIDLPNVVTYSAELGLCLDFSSATGLQTLNLGNAPLGMLDVAACPLISLRFGYIDWDAFYPGTQPNLTSIKAMLPDRDAGICNLSTLTALTDVEIYSCDKMILDGLALDTCKLAMAGSSAFDIQAVNTVINGTMTLTNGGWTIGQLESLFNDLANGMGTILVAGVAGISDGTWETVKAIATAKGYTVTDA